MENKKFKPSKYQKAIYSFIENGKGNAVVEAVAGSGKTTTIVEATSRIPPKDRAIFVAFNKSIATELSKKLPNHVNARTLHSLGYSMFFGNVPGKTKVDNNKLSDIINDVMKTVPYLDYNERDEMKTFFMKIIPKIKATLSDTDKESIAQLADYYNIFAFVNDQKVNLIKQILNRCLADTSRIDFDDMIWIPVMLGFKSRTYDWIFVDESQDLNKSQFELIKKITNGNTRIVAVGDSRQCQPSGNLVTLEGGKTKDISNIKVGDFVVSFRRDKVYFAGTKKQGRKVIAKSSRDYSGDMFTVEADGNKSTCTPNHKWIARFNVDKKNDLHYVVYLMERDKKFRIGWCKLFEKDGTLHLFHRARVEKANVWVLKVCKNKREASMYESIYSSQYGIPLVMFEPVPGNELYNQEFLNTVFRSIPDLFEKGLKCLKDFHKMFDFPFYSPNGKRTRNTIFEIQTCNLLSDIMSIPIYHGSKKVAYAPIKVSRKYQECKVYSLEVESNHTYVSNNMATHNSIYGFRGADSDSMDNFRTTFNATELPLSITYRCPKNVVKVAKQFVKNIEPSDTAKDGLVEPINRDSMLEKVEDGNLILCRTNAPLVKVAFELIKQRKKVVILGKDIGKNLIKIVDKQKAYDDNDLLKKVARYEIRQQELLRMIENGEYNPKYKSQVMNAIDSCAVITTVAQEVNTVHEVKSTIAEIFSDTKNGIICSSIHKAKGLENNRVFIYGYEELMPHPMAETPEEVKQEYNIKYVAITRAKKELYLVSDDTLLY
jgi:hypothetical protein